jgi:hypothetical protein
VNCHLCFFVFNFDVAGSHEISKTIIARPLLFAGSC